MIEIKEIADFTESIIKLATAIILLKIAIHKEKGD